MRHFFDIGLFKFENPSTEFKGTFLDNSIFYYLDGHPDWSEEDWRVEQSKELGMLEEGIRTLQEALPALCAKGPETSRALSTFLSHDDLSRRNIMVNDSGLPIALLDWEAIQMRPLLFLTNPPDYNQSHTEDYAPIEYDALELERKWRKLSQREEEIQKGLRHCAAFFEEKLEEHTCTKLRAVYTSELQRLGCPLARAVWDHYFFLDRQLQQRVLNISGRVDEHVEWVEAMLGMGEDESDTEDIEDDERMDDEVDIKDEDVEVEGKDQEACVSKESITLLQNLGFSGGSIDLWKKGIWKGKEQYPLGEEQTRQQ